MSNNLTYQILHHQCHHLITLYFYKIILFDQIEKMNCLDLLDDFEANKNEGLYINWDGHLNERGHALVGEKVVDYILEKELLK